MSDKEEENKQEIPVFPVSLPLPSRLQQDLAPAPASSQPEQAESSCPPGCSPAKKPRTTGNKIFDWGVYTTIAWAGVSAMSLFTAHEAIHGKNKYFGWLRTLHKGMTRGFEKAYSATFLKGAEPEKLKAWSENSALYWILGTGGSALMWPIKYLEDNRLRLASKIDRALGTTPPDPDAVAREPKQSWKSVFSGRAFSVGTGFLSFVAMGPKTADRASKWFGEKAANIYYKFKPIPEHLDAAAKEAHVKNVRKWADMSAFDVLFTVITASLMYGFSRFVARRSNTKDIDEMMTIDPSTPTPFEPVYRLAEEKSSERRFTDTVRPVEKTPEPSVLHAMKIAAESDQPAATRGA